MGKSLKKNSNLAFKSLLLIGLFFVLACERKADTDFVKIQLQLPAKVMSSQMGESFNSMLDPFASQSIVPLLDSKSINSKNIFNSVVPSLATNAQNPMNCILVVVSGPETEPDFSKNHCVKKTNPAVSSKNDISSPRLEFGPYVGLVDAFNYNNTIEMELKPGEGRVFTLLGFHAKESCSEIYSALRDKSKLSKAYRIGASTPQKLVGGSVIEVPIRLLSEVNSSDYFSDCTIPDPETIYPLYTRAEVTTTDYRKKIRSFSTNPYTNFMCEALEINLKTNDPYTQRLVSGTVAQDTYFQIKLAYADLTTYESERDCVNNVDANSKLKFVRNQISQRVWFRQQRYTNATLALEVKREDGSTIFTDTLGQENRTTSVFFDTILPTQLELDKCYMVTSWLRDFNGNVITSPNDFYLDNDTIPTVASAQIFSSLGDCEDGININPQLTFPYGLNSLSYWVKAGPQYSKFDYSLTLTSMTAVNVEPLFNTVGNTEVSNTDRDTLISLNTHGQTRIPNYGSQPVGTINCRPLFVSFGLKNKDTFVLGSSATSTMANMKVQVSDPSGPNTNGYTLYSNSSCSGTPIYPVGSTALAAGTDISSPVVGSPFYKLYIKTDGNSTYGQRKLMFYYQGAVAGHLSFDLVDDNH
ncbi:hypothetical protein [Pseudobdellovibrio exovorus]|uniref:Lipoprotein n=1 Tax=Pseudobdellovibrio exovorus JSS TaxID=1184267 RepID=M4VBK0_9BACT|nr:hypothetical protein [Pseudobdellovibrio exovorus]AGH95401.1 hypothetical protein A11Q_1185 [Pseudobdellovibrio exovorus JSS]